MTAGSVKLREATAVAAVQLTPNAASTGRTRSPKPKDRRRDRDQTWYYPSEPRWVAKGTATSRDSDNSNPGGAWTKERPDRSRSKRKQAAAVDDASDPLGIAKRPLDPNLRMTKGTASQLLNYLKSNKQNADYA